MLARVAENLYWMGRHIERVDFCNRFIEVQFFNSLSAPMSGHKDFILRSILYVSGSSFDSSSPLSEQEVWRTVIFDPLNPSSMFSSINRARENARSIRNTISAELWEAINKWYIFCKNRSHQEFYSSDLFWFSEQIIANQALIKSTMVNTILHDDVWHFLNVGISLERTMQVLKIIRTKISDSAILSNSGALVSLKLFQMSVMLRSIGAYDVHQTINKTTLMTTETIFNLVFSNDMFPRSTISSTRKIYSHLSCIHVESDEVEDFTMDFKSKMNLFNEFSDYSDEDAVIQHIEAMDHWLLESHEKIQDIFFLKD